MSATAGGAGDRDSLRSADGVGGTSRSDPGGGSRYNAGAVCIDEKVLKQIRYVLVIEYNFTFIVFVFLMRLAFSDEMSIVGS
jgi:hypothetical protein